MANLSMMLQTGGLTPDQIAKWMEHVHLVRHTPGGDNIVEFQIEHIAPAGGEPLWEQVDQVIPYAPGGPKKSMNNLFVGTSIIAPPATGSRYREGVTDPLYRKAQVQRAEELANQFADRYKNKLGWWHWYIDYEAVLNWWMEDDVRAGYEDLLVDWVKAYHRVRPASILFEPAYWNKNIPPGLQKRVHQTFENVKKRTNTKGVNWIGIQDMQGRDWVGSTTQDTANWVNMFKATGQFDAVWPLHELFEHIPNKYYGVGNAQDFRKRIKEYEALGMPHQWVFEIRYWYAMEEELKRGAETPGGIWVPPTAPAATPPPSTVVPPLSPEEIQTLRAMMAAYRG